MIINDNEAVLVEALENPMWEDPRHLRALSNAIMMARNENAIALLAGIAAAALSTIAKRGE